MIFVIQENDADFIKNTNIASSKLTATLKSYANESYIVLWHDKKM